MGLEINDMKKAWLEIADIFESVGELKTADAYRDCAHGLHQLTVFDKTISVETISGVFILNFTNTISIVDEITIKM